MFKWIKDLFSSKETRSESVQEPQVDLNWVRLYPQLRKLNGGVTELNYGGFLTGGKINFWFWENKTARLGTDIWDVESVDDNGDYILVTLFRTVLRRPYSYLGIGCEPMPSYCDFTDSLNPGFYNERYELQRAFMQFAKNEIPETKQDEEDGEE